LAKDEDAPMNPYVNELIASRKCEGDDRRVVCIADSGQKGTDVYWCQPASRWICVNLDVLSQIATAEEVALIRLHEDVDAEEGLTLRALASDCEREAGLWLVDGDDLEQLASRYGADLEILWSSKDTAAVVC
jgi:hypothetical protein